MRARTVSRLLILSSALLLVGALVGCSGLEKASDTRSVSDAKGLFHFKVANDWQVRSDENVLSLYADDKLPAEGERPKALSVLVLTSSEASAAPARSVLDYLIGARARARGWKQVDRGETKRTELGGREAWSVDVSALDADGRRFESRYVFARTGGSEVFIAAIAPDETKIGEFDEEIAGITKQWYWHVAEGATSGVTPTATPTATPAP